MDANQIKNSIEATFNDVSSRYDKNRFFAISAAKMADLVPEMEKMHVLDVSTGTGAVAIEVAKRHGCAKIEAIDLSSGMLDQAIQKAKEQGLDNIEFKQCDVEAMPYKEAVFDVVTCGYALFFYPDMEASYKAIYKTIKPGGVFIFSSFTTEAFNPYAEIFLSRIENIYHVEAPSRLRARLKTTEQINELATTNNHNNVEVIHHPIRYSITTDEWWALLNNAGYKSLLDQLTPEQLKKFKQEHLAEIDAVSNSGNIELNADTLFGIVSI